MENKELINALNVIKTECSKHEICKDCPLGNEARCGITENLEYNDPESWEIREYLGKIDLE